MTLIDPVRTRVDLASLDLRFARFPNAQPFSPRSASGYQELLEGLYRYVTKDLYTYLLAASGQTTWDNNVDALLAAVDGVLAQQKSDIDSETASALQTVINSTIAISDPVTLAIVSDATTATRKKLDSFYVQRALNARNLLTGYFHPEDFGATYSGGDDRAAVQAAVDAAAAVYIATSRIQYVYIRDLAVVGATDYWVNGTLQGVCGVCLKSGVQLVGPGGLQTKGGSYGNGAQYALVRGDGAGIKDAGIEDLTLDGNRRNNVAATQCNNVFIPGISSILLKNVKSYEANGNSLMVVGTFATPVADVLIEDCTVRGANTIGIQSSQFNGLTIHNNIVEGTTDNGIDIYGENQGSTVSNGISFKITDNKLRYNGNGIFPETVAHGIVANNIVADPANECVHVNRINGEPEDILVTGNKLFGGHSGVGVTGVMGSKNGLTIRNNTIGGFDQGGVLMGGAGDVANVYVLDNTMNGVTDMIPLVLCKSGTGTLSNFIHERTITKSKQRAYDTVNYSTASANNTWAPALSPGD